MLLLNNNVDNYVKTVLQYLKNYYSKKITNKNNIDNIFEDNSNNLDKVSNYCIYDERIKYLISQTVYLEKSMG